MKKFRDVAHLYIGCEVVSNYTGTRHIVKGVSQGQVFIEEIEPGVNGWADTVSFKPILRPINSITKQEAEKIKSCAGDNIYSSFNGEEIVTTAEAFAYMLSMHLDIFYLIDSGEAIDATKLNPNPYAGI